MRVRARPRRPAASAHGAAFPAPHQGTDGPSHDSHPPPSAQCGARVARHEDSAARARHAAGLDHPRPVGLGVWTCGVRVLRPTARGTIMDSVTNDFWDVLLWSFWFFIWITALMVWFRCL